MQIHCIPKRRAPAQPRLMQRLDQRPFPRKKALLPLLQRFVLGQTPCCSAPAGPCLAVYRHQPDQLGSCLAGANPDFVLYYASIRI